MKRFIQDMLRSVNSYNIPSYVNNSGPYEIPGHAVIQFMAAIEYTPDPRFPQVRELVAREV
jgi:hypothetical protein